MRTIVSHSLPAVTLLLIAAVVSGVPGAALAGSLTGAVKNSTDLAPIAGATVTVHVLIPDSIPFPAVTALDGSYDITGITPGNEIYVVIAYKNGFRESYTRVADLGSQDLAFDIILDPDTSGFPPPGDGGDSGNVAGTVYEAVGGGVLAGVSGATVSIYAGPGTAVVTTDPEGHYSARIPAGPFAVSVTGAGFDSLALTGLDVDSLGATVNAVVKKIVTEAGDDELPLPAAYGLSEGFPNPFNPATTITYTLPERGVVQIIILNTIGEVVATIVDGVAEAGRHTTRFDAGDLAGGVYFLRMRAADFQAVKKLLLLK